MQRNAIFLVLVLLFGLPLTTMAQKRKVKDSQGLQLGPHGGRMLFSRDTRYEVLVTKQSLLIYVFNKKLQPVSTQKMRGHVTFSPASDRRTFRHDIFPLGSDVSNGLYLSTDVGQLSDRPVNIRISLYGLPSGPVSVSTSLEELSAPGQVFDKPRTAK